MRFWNCSKAKNKKDLSGPLVGPQIALGRSDQTARPVSRF